MVIISSGLQQKKENWRDYEADMVDVKSFKYKTYYESYNMTQKIRLFIDIDMKNVFNEKDINVVDDSIYAKYSKDFFISKSHRYINKEGIESTNGDYKVSYHLVHRKMYFDNLASMYRYAMKNYKSNVLSHISEIYKHIYKRNMTHDDSIFDTKVYKISDVNSTRRIRCLYQKKYDCDNTYSDVINNENINVSDMLVTQINDNMEYVYVESINNVDDMNLTGYDDTYIEEEPFFDAKFYIDCFDLIDNEYIYDRDNCLKLIWASKNIASYFPLYEDDIRNKCIDKIKQFVPKKVDDCVYSDDKINEIWNKNPWKNKGKSITFKTIPELAKKYDENKCIQLKKESLSRKNRSLMMSKDSKFSFDDFTKKYDTIKSFESINDVYSMLYDLQKVFAIITTSPVNYLKKKFYKNYKCMDYESHIGTMASHEYMDTPIMYKYINNKNKEVYVDMPLYKFIKHNKLESMFKYSCATFRPYVGNTKIDYDEFNLFTGFDAKYIKNYDTNNEGIVMFDDYIRQVICNNFNESYIYVTQLLARVFRKPYKRHNAALALYSKEQGTGKNWFYKCIGGIIGNRYIQNYNHIIDLNKNFNSELDGKLFCVLDEICDDDYKNKKIWAIAKSKITADTISINTKFKREYNVKNLLTIGITTNDENAIRLELNDRRYAMLEVSNIHQRDTTYFTKLLKLVKDNKDAIYSYYYDMYDFNIKRLGDILPNTPWKIKQEKKSVNDIWIFLKQCIKHIELLPKKQCKDLYNLYNKWCLNSGKKCNMKNHTFGVKLTEYGFTKKRTSKGIVYDINETTIKENFSKLNCKFSYDELTNDDMEFDTIPFI